MRNIIILSVMVLLGLTGCSTYIANAPFYNKSVSDKAIEKDGMVEYNRVIKVTPTKALIPIVVTNSDNTTSIKMVPPELIIAGGEAAGKFILPIVKSVNDSSVDLRGAAQIEVTETYKHNSK